MPNEKSLPGSAAEFDYQKAASKSEHRFLPRFLRVNKYLNRPAASLIVRAVYRTRVTPNQLTYLSLLIGLAGAFCFFQGRRPGFLLGGILIQLASIVDCADGMLARARHKESEYGAFLDLVFDRVTEFFLIAGYAYGFYRATGRQSVFVLGLVAAGLYFLQISVYYLLKLYYGDPTPGDTAESRALLLFLAALFGVMNRLDLGIYTLFTVSVTVNAVLLIRFLRSRRA